MKRRRYEFPLGRQKNAKAGPLTDGSPTASDTAEVMWLRDLLPELVPNARIATYSYKSDWKANVTTSLSECGEQLLNVIHQNRSTEKVGRVVSGVLRPSLLRITTGASETADLHRT